MASIFIQLPIYPIKRGWSTLVSIPMAFKNNLATTRGLVSGLRAWEAVLPIEASLGDFQNGDMENIAYTITH